MADREKIINGLECCAVGCRSGCPYSDIDDDCEGVLCADALALLKAQDKDAEIIRKCRDGEILKHVGNGVVVLNFEWWRKMVEKCDHIKVVPSVEDLVKAQEPRVMSWEEAHANVKLGPFIVMELRDSTGTEIDYGVLVGDSYEMSEGSLLTVCDFGLLKDDYGRRFRCWTSRPTDEQRKAVKWDE